MGVRATELRKGTVIQENGQLWLIVEYMHHTPGNLRAVIHCKMKNIQTGQTRELRLGSGDVYEVAYLDKKKCEYLYRESDGKYVFMDQETYEQFPLDPELVEDKMGYVRENTVVDVTFHESLPLGVELPASVTLKVIEAEHAVKGNTSSNPKKDAIVETGLKVKVPFHVVAGDQIKISTADGEFQGRDNS